MPNRSSTPRLIRAANPSTSRAVAPPRLTIASGCLVEIPTLPVRITAAEASALDQPRGRQLHPAAIAANAGGCVPATVPTRWRSISVTTGFMKNDPTLRVSGSCRIDHHALPPADGQHGIAHPWTSGAGYTRLRQVLGDVRVR